MIFIAVAVVTVQMLRRDVFRDPAMDDKPPSSRAKVLALTSLVCWLGAIV